VSIPDENKLNEIAQKLAKVLRVQDWDITVHSVTGYGINKINGDCENDGLACRNIRLNTAEIYINNEKEIDWYETLVHEMIHIQSTALINCAEAYFQETHSYFTDIYENFVEKQAQIFSKIYPLERLESEVN
jgi:dephospho-CoA kinase